MILDAIFLGCCLVLFTVPIYFVRNRVYEDGLIGRIFLLGISFASAGFLLAWCDSDEWPRFDLELAMQTYLIVISFAGFIVWHLFRWHSKVLKKQTAAANK